MHDRLRARWCHGRQAEKGQSHASPLPRPTTLTGHAATAADHEVATSALVVHAVARPLVAVALAFNEPVMPELARVVVSGPDGRDVAVGAAGSAARP
jgi:hypothetical protein